jgi:hypothetical protein
MTPMKPTQGKRPWVKLWTNEWLDGTTRYQMSDAQRAFWVDLLAMAGRSRFPGIICAGRDDEHFVGYPLTRFQSLMAQPLDIEATLAIFERTGKVKITTTSEGPPRLFVIELLNWRKYQSDLDAQAERARNYRIRKKAAASRERHASVTLRHAAEVEAESETESETETEQQKELASLGPPAAAAAIIGAAFRELGFTEPFGNLKFQRIWAEEWERIPPDANGGGTDAMERTAQRCKKQGVAVPPIFYKVKRKVEEAEVEHRFGRTPL